MTCPPPAVSAAPPAVLAALEGAERLFDAAAVLKAVDQAAVRVSVLLAERNPLLYCVMHGGLPFAAALMQRLHFPLELGYLHVSRYRGETRGGELNWHAAPSAHPGGRHVLIADDILDQGVTLAALRDWALAEGASSVTIAVLVDKRIAGARPIEADVAALICPDRYLFGWGMDYRGYWRNLPAIYALGAGQEGG